MKKLMWIVLFVACLVGMNVVASNAEETDFISVFEAGKKASVEFDHGKHIGLVGDCAICHEQLPESGVDKKVGHGMCKQCHKDGVALYPNAPVRCTGCHAP